MVIISLLPLNATSLKAIDVRTQAIHLSLRADVLIGNIQICILRCVLQKSRIVSLQAYLRMAELTLTNLVVIIIN